MFCSGRWLDGAPRAGTGLGRRRPSALDVLKLFRRMTMAVRAHALWPRHKYSAGVFNIVCHQPVACQRLADSQGSYDQVQPPGQVCVWNFHLKEAM